jgi:PAS domain S-box-containing protein
METKFELREQDYRYLFDNASDAMWVHDMEGSILDGNKAFEKLTGYTREELIGMNATRLLVSEEYLNLAREVRRRLLKGEALEQPYEQRLLRKDGTTRIVNMATSPVIIDGEVRGFQHVARDVTEERQLRENMYFYAQQITRAQEDERKRIARELHDEASPLLLLLIQGLDTVSTGTRPRLSESLKNSLESIRSQAINALEGLQRCAQSLRPRILDDLGLLPALEWMAEDLVKKHGIDAHVEVIGNERSLLAEVELLLFRIAQEALSNTRRHAEASRAVVKLEFGNNRIKMTVSDNGKGFELPERIGDLASVGKLGLAGMQERARLLGGSLKIESELGKGTTVAVEAPL